MKWALVPFIAMRYLRAKRRESGFAPSLLSVLGVAVGVMTLTVVLGIMNGFQLGFIENIVEISSYHLQIRSQNRAEAGGGLSAKTLDALKSSPSVLAVIPFSDLQCLVEGRFSRARPCIVRIVPQDVLSMDAAQARLLSMTSGSFSLSEEGSIVIGSELAAATGAKPGDTLFLVSADSSQGRLVSRRDSLKVAGIFNCGYYDFDVGLAFISFRTAAAMAPRATRSVTYGVKLADRFRDEAALGRIQRLLAGSGFRAESWRVYNRSFFDALFMEKLMMMFLVGLIFVVVGFNIFNSLRRTVFEKREEIAVLKAVGVSPRSIQYAFVFEGFVIGLFGALTGLIAGLALAQNVNRAFSVVEAGVNGALRAAWAVIEPLQGAAASESFSIFSPLYFYLTAVPSKVLLPETIFVASFALLASVTAAFGASRAVAAFRPAEILRYE